MTLKSLIERPNPGVITRRTPAHQFPHRVKEEAARLDPGSGFRHPFIMPRLLRLTALTLLVGLLLTLGLLTGCQSKLIYFPRPYGPTDVSDWNRQAGTEVLAYQTTVGRQQAYLLKKSTKPERLWIVCGGNGTVALDWSAWLREHGTEKDAWLLFDMPGYGANEGDPSPWTIRRSLRAAVPAATGSLGWSATEAQPRLRFFGHSLGAGVCLMAAQEFDIRKGVLLAPFTSTMDMSREVLGVPLGFLLWHRFDNQARLRELDGKGGASVAILHGRDDEVIPVRMSRQMAAELPSTIHYTEVPAARHNTLQDMAIPAILQAMEKVRN